MYELSTKEYEKLVKYKIFSYKVSYVIALLGCVLFIIGIFIYPAISSFLNIVGIGLFANAMLSLFLLKLKEGELFGWKFRFRQTEELG